MFSLLAVFGFLALFQGTYGTYCQFGLENRYCSEGCCTDDCCEYETYETSTSLSAGYIVLIIFVVIAKLVFWVACCYCCRRRSHHVTVVSQQQVITVPQTNPNHAGYIQGQGPASPPPYSQAGAQGPAPPPAYMPPQGAVNPNHAGYDQKRSGHTANPV